MGVGVKMTDLEGPERDERIPVSFSPEEASATFDWLFKTALGVAALLSALLVFGCTPG